MTRLFLAAGVAALALVMPAGAKPGGDKGGGHGGNAPAAHSDGDRGGKAVRAQSRRGGPRAQAQSIERRGGGGGAVRMQSFHSDRGGGQRMHAVRTDRSSKRGERAAVQAQRRHGGEARMNVADRRQQRATMHGKSSVHQQVRADNRAQRQQARIAGRDQLRANRVQELDRRFAGPERIRAERLAQVGVRDFGDRDRWDRGFSRGLIEGCPPGLWMKNNGCLPPGQAKKLIGNVLPASLRAASLPAALSAFYPDTNDDYWRYGDGYMYRVDRTSNLVNSLLPLIGGGYVPGMMFPSAYAGNYMSGSLFPTGYMSPYATDSYGWNAFYPDTSSIDYRYLNGNVYGVDPYSGLIEDVIPTYGYGYGVGQMLPAGYGYYNVPYQYRDLYYDTPNYNYWYAPGAIYQVDPASQLITAVASLLAPGLAVGQPLPMGYDAYNVPYSYRSTYYDTPTAWYRYNNGYIYQVDPTTRLVTAIVASLLT